eukprot:5117774-Ditylum_brightwellii.AAC.1
MGQKTAKNRRHGNHGSFPSVRSHRPRVNPAKLLSIFTQARVHFRHHHIRWHPPNTCSVYTMQ